jgi:hypothetical protein
LASPLSSVLCAAKPSSRHPPTQPPSRKLQQPLRRPRKRYTPIAALNMVGSDVTIAIVLVPEVGAAYFPEYLIAERWARPGLEGKRRKCEYACRLCRVSLAPTNRTNRQSLLVRARRQRRRHPRRSVGTGHGLEMSDTHENSEIHKSGMTFRSHCRNFCHGCTLT